MKILLFCMLLCTIASGAELQVKNGETVVFLGDSITREGNVAPGGWIHLVVDGLKRFGVAVNPVPSGVGSNTSGHLVERLERDALSARPGLVVVNCGLNDVVPFRGGVRIPLPDFQKNITEITDRIQKSGARVIWVTPSYAEFEDDYNQRLQPYIAFLTAFTAERKLPLTDINTPMREFCKGSVTPGGKATRDGIHFNGHGNVLFAAALLKTLGLSDAQIAALRADWENLPGAAAVTLNLDLTLAEYRKLETEAVKRRVWPIQVLYDQSKSYVKSLENGTPIQPGRGQ